MRDIYYAFRSLWKSPGFMAAAVLTLAIGIGANTAMFSVLYAVVFEPLGIHDPSRVVMVWETDRHNASLREGASAPDYFDWLAQQRPFSSMAGMTMRMMNFTAGTSDPERIGALGVPSHYFDLVGVKPIAGRVFSRNDDRVGASPVALISETLWQRRFGGDAVAGRDITLDGVRYTISGVVPAAAALGRQDVEVWVPFEPTLGAAREIRGQHGIGVVARLRDGVSVKQAESEMNVVAARLERLYPDDNQGRGVFVEPVRDYLLGDVRPRLYVLSAAVAGVLLIACLNVAGLLLARGDSRAREVAIRASLGASRARLMRHFLAESVVIALAGGTLGLLLASWTTDLLRAIAPTLPRASTIDLNMPVLFFAFLVSAVAAVIFGLAPSFRASSVVPALALGGGRGVTRRVTTKARALLVAGEIALTVMLVIAAGLLLQSFTRLSSVDLGMKTENVMTFGFSLPSAKYPQPPRAEYPVWPKASGFQRELLDSTKRVPGVTGVAVALNRPLDSGWTSRIEIAGRTPTSGPPDEVRIRPVSEGYFELLGIPLLRGRSIAAQDRAGTPFVVVINEALASRYFPNENPVGKTLSFWATPRTIIGVVKGERFGGPENAPEAAVYPPMAQAPAAEAVLLVRTSGDPKSVVPSVRKVVRSIDPSLALYDIETLEEAAGNSVASQRFQAVLITSFGVIALVLATLGLYALIAHEVQQRTNEIGIRLALGAQRREIARLILVHATVIGGAGVVAGLVGALAAGRFLESLLFKMKALDPALYTGVPLLIIATALLAAYIPTRRAMNVDPAVAMRYE
ncbi:MAG TPA: ABC transporter permease [Thermoanaerobaculia bacterium]|jgi:putative ABC transport system permease protein